MKRILIIFLIVLFPGIRLLAQDSHLQILHKSSGQPIPYANVCWQRLDRPDVKEYAISNGAGTVNIDQEGELILSVTCLGFKPYLDTLRMEDRLKIHLETDILNLDQVVITGTRTNKTLRNTPVLTKVVSSTDISQMASVNVLEALEFSMPGVHFSPDAHGDNLQIQGLDNDYVLVLLDGQRLVGETRGNVDFDRIDVDNIDRVEIINGASSVLYGSNAIGAVINIITKKNQKPFEASMGSQVESYGKMRLNMSSRFNHKKWGGGISAFRDQSGGYDLTPESPGSYTITPYTDYSVNLQTSYQVNPGTSASVSGTWFRHELSNPEASAKSTHDMSMDYTLGAKLTSILSGKNTLTLKASSDANTSFTVYEKKDDQTEKDGKFSNTVIQLTDHHVFGDKLNIIGGLEQNIEQAYSLILFSGGEDDGGNNKIAWDANAFAQVDHFLLKNLEVVLAGRFTYHSDYKAHFTPKFSLMYSPGRFRFRGNVATGYRAPSLRELFYDFDHHGMFWIYGNPDLQPESSFYTSVSAEYTLKSLNLNTTLYRNSIENKIETIDVINEDRLELHYMNVSEALLQGMESYLSIGFPDHFKFRMGYAFSDAEDLSTGLQLYGNSKHSGTCGLTYQLYNIKAPLSVNVSGRASSSRLFQYAETETDPESGEDITSIYTDESDPYHIWKITYKQMFTLTRRLFLEVNAGVNNIFDYRDEEYQAIVDPGRRYFAGIRLQFY